MHDINPSILRRAYEYAVRNSDDPRTQNGAVLVDRRGSIIAESANVYPLGTEITRERSEAPLKYAYIGHAERGAIHKAARLGLPTKGAILYCPWFACMNCAMAIIQSGISTVVGHQQMRERTHATWDSEISQAEAWLDECGVDRIYYDGTFGGIEILFKGVAWHP